MSLYLAAAMKNWLPSVANTTSDAQMFSDRLSQLPQIRSVDKYRPRVLATVLTSIDPAEWADTGLRSEIGVADYCARTICAWNWSCEHRKEGNAQPTDEELLTEIREVLQKIPRAGPRLILTPSPVVQTPPRYIEAHTEQSVRLEPATYVPPLNLDDIDMPPPLEPGTPPSSPALVDEPIRTRVLQPESVVVMRCLDCGILDATWRFLPCRCIAVCGRCKDYRKLSPGVFTRCPVCNAWNKGSFKHV